MKNTKLSVIMSNSLNFQLITVSKPISKNSKQVNVKSKKIKRSIGLKSLKEMNCGIWNDLTRKTTFQKWNYSGNRKNSKFSKNTLYYSNNSGKSKSIRKQLMNREWKRKKNEENICLWIRGPGRISKLKQSTYRKQLWLRILQSLKLRPK